MSHSAASRPLDEPRPRRHAPPAPEAPRFVAPEFLRQTADPPLPTSLDRINWTHFLLLTVTPLLALYGLVTVPLVAPTAIWAAAYYFWSIFGITAGYHRYWSHRSYDAGPLMRWWLLLGGTGAVQGSVRWWGRGHRQHHRYTDTYRDPYSARKGLLWSHIGWMLTKEDPANRGPIDVLDLDADGMVRWQHRNYGMLALLMGFIWPAVVAGVGWGDWKGGFFYAGITRLVVVHHATFCVNSLAHYLGDATYTDRLTPRNHLLTALVTGGEGYHNFHHEFPHDYRNAIRWWQYDPTKWLIRGAAALGLAHGLRTMPDDAIRKGELLQIEKELARQKARLSYGTRKDELPSWTWEEFQALHIEGRKLLCISNVIYDVADFLPHHPGGRHLIKLSLGRDVTAAFNGGVYFHGQGARHILQGMAIAKLDPPVGPDVELDSDGKPRSA
ncbi:delta-9 desaturase [Hyaloraphidium curvatum]|nr:delta-9 desaturase [Hyaloraphidium curvatum]